MPLSSEEKAILGSVEGGEWRSVKDLAKAKSPYASYSKAAFRKDRRVNIRISSKDLQSIQVRAVEEGLPYQTLIASLVHKYVSGRLKEV